MITSPPFLGLHDRLADGRVPRAIIFAAGHGSTYPGKDSSGYVLAAGAIRAASQDDVALVDHWDFDLDGPLFDGKSVCCIDAGDIPTIMHDNAGNRARIEVKTREVLALPAVPILLGGDCSVTIPFVAGFRITGRSGSCRSTPISTGATRCMASATVIRARCAVRARMPHVAGIVQVGLRSVGSARLTDIEAAQHYGSRFVTAREVHTQGIEAALRHIPEGARVVVTLDCDSLDPSIMPGVAARTPGGLTYTQVIDLIAGLGRRARTAGFDLVELYPPADIDGLSALTAARLLVNMIGTVVRQV